MRTAKTYGEPAIFETHFIPFWNTAWFVGGLAIVAGVFEPFIGYRGIAVVFLLGVVGVGVVAKDSPFTPILAAILSSAAWDFFFIPPRFTFAIANVVDLGLFASFFAASIAMAFLGIRLKQRRTRDLR